MSTDLAVGVDPLPVVVADGSDRPQQGTIFLRTASQWHTGRETLGERIGDQETQFLPIDRDGEVELVRLGAIDWIGCPADALAELAELEILPSYRQAVQIELESAEILVGELRYEAPEHASRISDLLNDRGRRFLLLTTGDEARYVNRERIRRVRFGVDLCP